MVAIPSCQVHHPRLNEAVRLVEACMERLNLKGYREDTHTGELRYIQVTAVPYHNIQLGRRISSREERRRTPEEEEEVVVEEEKGTTRKRQGEGEGGGGGNKRGGAAGVRPGGGERKKTMTGAWQEEEDCGEDGTTYIHTYIHT